MSLASGAGNPGSGAEDLKIPSESGSRKTTNKEFKSAKTKLWRKRDKWVESTILRQVSGGTTTLSIEILTLKN